MRSAVRAGSTIVAALVLAVAFATSAVAATPTSVSVWTSGRGPDDLFGFDAYGLAADTTTTIAIDGVGSSYHHALPTRSSTASGIVENAPGERTPADLTPGTYSLTFSQATPALTASTTFTISAPAVLIGYLAVPGKAFEVSLHGFAGGAGVQRTDSVDGVPVPHTQVENQFTLSDQVMIPGDIAIGPHMMTISQQAGPAATVSASFEVAAPELEVTDQLPVPEHGRVSVRGSQFGVGESVALSVVDGSGRRSELPPQTGPSFVADVELPGLAAGTATITATGTRAGATSSATFTVRAAQLAASQRLDAGNEIDSATGRTRLVMQPDGNLVAYVLGLARWSSRTQGHPGAYAVLQADGNLVVYSAGRPLWASNTSHQPTAVRLVAQDDGNVVMYSATGRAVWASGSVQPANVLYVGQRLAAYGRLTADPIALVVQPDGNVVLLGRSGTVTWATNTGVRPGLVLAVLRGGEFAVVDPTQGDPNRSYHFYEAGKYSPGARLVLQSDGNLVEYTPSGRAVWSSGTAGR